MEILIPVLKVICGIGMIAMFLFLIFYSLDNNAVSFIKYLLFNLLFCLFIGFLFYVFRNATLLIATLAFLGWGFLILFGTRQAKKIDQTQIDSE